MDRIAARIRREHCCVGYTGLARRATNGDFKHIAVSSPFAAMFGLNHDTTHRHYCRARRPLELRQQDRAPIGKSGSHTATEVNMASSQSARARFRIVLASIFFFVFAWQSSARAENGYTLDEIVNAGPRVLRLDFGRSGYCHREDIFAIMACQMAIFSAKRAAAQSLAV